MRRSSRPEIITPLRRPSGRVAYRKLARCAGTCAFLPPACPFSDGTAITCPSNPCCGRPAAALAVACIQMPQAPSLYAGSPRHVHRVGKEVRQGLQGKAELLLLHHALQAACRSIKCLALHIYATRERSIAALAVSDGLWQAR